MWRANTPLQKTQNALAEKIEGLEDARVTHAQETTALRARIVELENELAQERTTSAAAIHRLT